MTSLSQDSSSRFEGERPTKAALIQAILRAHYQAMVWKNDIIPNPRLPSPTGFGWTLEKGNSSKAYHRESDQNNIKLYGFSFDSDEWYPVMTQQ